jgi:hypothetical protein
MDLVVNHFELQLTCSQSASSTSVKLLRCPRAIPACHMSMPDVGMVWFV